MTPRLPLVLLLLLAACSPGASKTAAAPAAPDSPSVKQVHDDFLTPGSDALFAAESGASDKPELWTSAAAGAAKLIDGAGLLETGSRLKDSDRWLKISQAVIVSARKALDAAKRKDADAMAAADGEFTAQCEDCHNIYRDKGHGMMNDPTK